MQEDMETEEPVSNKEVLSKTHVQMDSIAGHAVEHMEGSPRSSESKLVDRPKVSMAGAEVSAGSPVQNAAWGLSGHCSPRCMSHAKCAAELGTLQAMSGIGQ